MLSTRIDAPIYWVILFAAAFAAYGGLLLLWAYGPQHIYFGLVEFFGIRVWPYPFLDIEGVLSWNACAQKGHDVVAHNPCDPLGRLFNYGPLLLDLPLHWIGMGRRFEAGIVVGIAVLAVLPFVLRPADGKEFAVAVIASLSPAVLFALERANIDALIFALIASVTILPAQSLGTRFFAYGVFLFTGMLKFYPFALLALIAREPTRRFVLILAFAILIIAAYAAIYWNMLGRIHALLPDMIFYGDMFGAVIFPYGVAEYVGLPRSAGVILRLLLTALIAAAAGVLAPRIASAVCSKDWETPRFRLLTTGALLVCACFFMGDNVGYRAIFLLFVFAGLAELRRKATSDPGLRRILGISIVLALLCLWSEFFRHGIDTITAAFVPETMTLLRELPSVIFFLVREAVWWSLVLVLTTIFLAFLSTTPLVQQIRGLFARGGAS